MGRDWAAAHAKVNREPCRVCFGPLVDPAHIIPRSRVKPGPGEDARNIVPLCRKHHREYDETGFDLLPYLTREEEAYAVELVGLYEAYRRITNTREPA